MEYRVTLATAAPNLAVIDDAIRDADPAALVDQDPADGTLRVIHIIAKPIAVARGTRDSGRARRDYKKLKMGFLC